MAETISLKDSAEADYEALVLTDSAGRVMVPGLIAYATTLADGANVIQVATPTFRLPVDLSTSTITALPPPAAITGFSTAANQATANASLASIAAEDFATETTLAAVNAKLPALGQALAAASVPVTLASDQPSVPVTVGNPTLKLTYGAAVAFTLTGASLASDTGLLAGRQSAAVSNATARATDYIIGGKIATGTSPTASRTIEIWAYGSFDDAPTYPAGITGSDGNLTITSSGIKGAGLRLVAILETDNTTGRSYTLAPTSLRGVFGGIVPKSFGLFVVHNTGVALSATAGDCAFSYTPLNEAGA